MLRATIVAFRISQQRAMVQGYIDDIVDHVNTGSMPGRSIRK